MNAHTRIPSLVLGAVALAGSFSLGRTTQDAKDWEYRIEIDVDENDVKKMAKDGWEFAAYLGTSVRGVGTDETLWRKPKR